MKNALKKWYNYFYMVGGIALLVAGGVIPHFLAGPEAWPVKYICYFMMFGGVVFLGGGFIAQDLYRGYVRHKINDWDNKLEDKYINKAWSIFFPFFSSGLVTFLVGLIFYLFIK